MATTHNLCGRPKPREALRAGQQGGPILAADSLQADQPTAIVLVAGTHHTDGIDETAFDQERADLFLPLLQVDVDGAEWKLPLKAKPICFLRENGQGSRVQDQEPVPLLL